jgi:hypothetical protein
MIIKIETPYCNYYYNMEILTVSEDAIRTTPELIVAKPFLIKVKTVIGAYHTIPVSSTTTIPVLKERIAALGEYIPNQLRIICNGKQLAEDSTLADYKITKDSVLHLVLSIRGGMFHETSARQDMEWLKADLLKEIEELTIS